MQRLQTVLHYLGVVLLVFAFLQLLPLLVGAIHGETLRSFVLYMIPAAISAGLGMGLILLCKVRPMSAGGAMAVGTLGWFSLSLIGAVPYYIWLDITYLTAVFETVSGFTTTGATMFVGVYRPELLPVSLQFWRALTQWIGGLGIFTLFLLVALRAGTSHTLLEAESHKAASPRFSPGLFSSLRILWGIYIALTVACGLLLWIEGMTPFDAATHALTTVSTGGFSTHETSIAHFSAGGVGNAVAIEYTIVAFMFLGGTSFLVHWNLIRRRFSYVRRNTELRLWVLLLLGATLLVALKGGEILRTEGLHAHVRTSLFQVVSLATTTGFATRDIGDPAFSALARQVFLILMLFGGCVGSTAGGLKVKRIAVMGKLLAWQLRRLARPSREVIPCIIDGVRVRSGEIERTAAIVFAWAALAVAGGLVAGVLDGLQPGEALSGALSALGNVGPSYIAPARLASIGPPLKVCYILLMIAGRLEILPLLLIFSRRVWR